MYFSNFSRQNLRFPDSMPFLTCKIPHHEEYFLDSVCVDEACKEKNHLVCILCQYESHKKHKIQPLEVFISKYKQMLLKETGSHPMALELNVDHVIFIYQQTFEKLNKIMLDLQESFSKLLIDLNETYSEKLSKINEFMKDENEILKLKSLKEVDFTQANKNIQELLNRISTTEDEFKLKYQRKSPEELSKTISSINNLEKYIDKELEKSAETFKKSMHLALNKFSEMCEEEKPIEKTIVSHELKNIIPNKIISEGLFENKMKKSEALRVDFGFRQKENELLMRNYQFNSFLEALKNDFSHMVEKLDSLQTPGPEFLKPDFFSNKRDFIAEFETMMKLPKKDLVYWN